MESLGEKLSQLGYEVFGIFVPGFLGICGFLLTSSIVLCALGTDLPSHEDLATTWDWVREVQLPLLSLALVGSYFYGHFLKAASSGIRCELSEKLQRWLEFRFLFFMDTKIEPKYPEELEPLLTECIDSIKTAAHAGASMKDLWPIYFPVLRCRVAKRGSKSLVSTFQNKYTLHRSLAAACSVALWVEIIFLLVSALFGRHSISAMPGLLVVALLCFFFVRVFARSYKWYWEQFSRSLISEAYAAHLGR